MYAPSPPASKQRARARGGAAAAWQRTHSTWRLAAAAERAILSVSVPAWTIAVAAMCLGIYALVLYLHADLTLVQGDAIGHIYVARRVIDSVTPSFAQFGYVWLPLPHLLMIPLVWNDTMWTTGLAGSIVSLIAYALTSVYIYRLTRLLSGSGIAGIICAALFATNPNVLFMQTTPMGEIVMILFIVASAYHLVRWAQDGSTLHLILSAGFVFCGTLCRYEVWWLVPVGTGIVMLASLLRYGFSRRIEALTITWVMLASYGIFLWLVYNYVIFGDPLRFIHDIGSAQSFARERAAEGALPSKSDPFASARLYGWALIDVAGLPAVLVGVGGFIALIVSRLPLGVKLAALLPASLFLFEVLSLTKAQSAMLSPHSAIPDMVNTRYGLLLLPAIVILACMLARQLRIVGLMLLFAALVPQLMILPTPSGVFSLREREMAKAAQPGYSERWAQANFPFLRKDQPVTLVEAVVASGESRLAIQAESNWLHDHAKTGKILVSEHFHASALVLFSKFNLSRFIYEGNYPYFHEEIQSPGRHTEWIIYQPNVYGDQVRPLVAGGHPPGFQLVFEDKELQIFHRYKEEPLGRPASVPMSAHLLQEDVSLEETAGTVVVGETYAGLHCANDVTTVLTTRGTLYTDLPCNEVPDDHVLLGQSVGMLVAYRNGITRVDIDGALSGHVSFTVPHAWIELRSDHADAVQIQDDGVPRPDAVPAAARRLAQDITLGTVGDNSEFAHRFYTMTCNDDVAGIHTTIESLYVQMPCGEFPHYASSDSPAVKITVGLTYDSAHVRIEFPDRDPIEFTGGRVWLRSN